MRSSSVGFKGNPYKVLGVSRFSSWDDAKSRYRYLTKLYHPDNIGSGDIDKFREVNEAWKRLQEMGSGAFGAVKKGFTHKSLFEIVQKRR